MAFSIAFVLLNVLCLLSKYNAEIISISLSAIDPDVLISEDVEGGKDHLTISQNLTKAYPPPRVTVPINKILLDLEYWLLEIKRYLFYI